MRTTKPHKGTIENWLSVAIPGCGHLGLGTCIIGDTVDHPKFGKGTIRTSWVVRHDGNEVETRNSRYTLGRPAIVQ